MKKVAIIYWSGTGNTEMMANAIAEGASKAGSEVTVFPAADFTADQMNNFDSFAFGCPSMGAEELEDSEFAPMFEDCKAELEGKNIALFGSYGWGDGEWMRNWAEECQELGASFACDYLICNNQPDEDTLALCQDMGKALS